MGRWLRWVAVALLAGCGGSSHPEADAGIDAAPIACASDRDCSVHGLVCDGARGYCVECIAASDCTTEEICLGGDCVPRMECTSSRMCPGLVCDTARGFCVQCVNDVDCAPAETCRDGACVPHAATCGSDADCDDGMWCNGAERCAPATPGADAAGCVAGPASCGPGACDETADRCTNCDADADGHASIGCGGDDCDDASATVYPGAAELCDGVDEDCSAGGGRANDEDGDADGYAPVGASCSGGSLPATDCDDGDAMQHPGATELCNGADEDCDRSVDEPPASAGCAIGETCVAGRCVAATGAVFSVGAGGNHTCAILGSGAVACWGRGREGQLGDGSLTDLLRPVLVAGIGDATSLAVGGNTSYALRPGGTVVAWGDNGRAQIGDGTTATRPTPMPVTGLTGVSLVAAGASHACAALATGRVMCWGDNDSGQLGDGSTAMRTTPVEVMGLTNAAAVACGSSFTCAIRADRTLACWGQNSSYELGDPSATTASHPDRTTPVTAFDPPLAVDEVGLGSGHACARDTGGVSCWGMLPETGGVPALTPLAVMSLADAAQLGIGLRHDCARRAAGGAVCWGRNDHGELGRGTSGAGTGAPDPAPVLGVSDAVFIGSGSSAQHTCAILASGSVSCWGWNAFGQLGDGTTMDRSTPVTVVGLP